MKRSTTELLSLLKSARDINEYLEKNSESFSAEKPCEYLEKIIAEKGLVKSEIIKKSGIERHYAYQIFSGRKTPSRDKLIMLCLGMGLDAEESQNLLIKCASPVLYAKNKRDNIVIFSLQNKLSLIEMNELLFELGLEIFE